MNCIIEINGVKRKVNLSDPIDISIPLTTEPDNVNAWYVPSMKIEPVMTEHFTGSVKAGGSVNFRNISFNPHGNGTHTECVGHIDQEVHSINQALTQFFFEAEVVTIEPAVLSETQSEWQKAGDHIITKQQIEKAIKGSPEAIVIRTSPNTSNKKHKQYSNSNWPYIEPEAAAFISKLGIKHLLIDLPSVDREEDGGLMLAHKAFWNFREQKRMNATITEMIYVPQSVLDGSYLLNLQIASFENDASPSKPVLYCFN